MGTLSVSVLHIDHSRDQLGLVLIPLQNRDDGEAFERRCCIEQIIKFASFKVKEADRQNDRGVYFCEDVPDFSQSHPRLPPTWTLKV